MAKTKKNVQEKLTNTISILTGGDTPMLWQCETKAKYNKREINFRFFTGAAKITDPQAKVFADYSMFPADNDVEFRKFINMIKSDKSYDIINSLVQKFWEIGLEDAGIKAFSVNG